MSIDSQGNLHGAGGRFTHKTNREPAGLSLVPSSNDAVSQRIIDAVSMRPGAAEAALNDPDPFVRVSALGAGWDLPDDRRDEALEDPEVSQIMEAISA